MGSMILRKDNPEKAKLIDHMYELLENPDKELTEWEQGFIDSTKEQWSNRWWLSERQFEILDRIYAEKTS